MPNSLHKETQVVTSVPKLAPKNVFGIQLLKVGTTECPFKPSWSQVFPSQTNMSLQTQLDTNVFSKLASKDVSLIIIPVGQNCLQVGTIECL